MLLLDILSVATLVVTLAVLGRWIVTHWRHLCVPKIRFWFASQGVVSKAGFAPSPHLALVDGDIGQLATAEKVAQTVIGKLGSIDHVVNNAGIFAVKPFIDYTADEFRSFVSTDLEGGSEEVVG